ncbi:unnamed protein product [Brachionus calyciflorus]|uniref:G-protein coupled receptors family 1 profile domain-containing protein n=1 Tax=Brachionus calyciflorus TaxID=104777 RepID=A0A813QEM3_9BILA|nr:unnamed protein product [Brachionus calyciflorus]
MVNLTLDEGLKSNLGVNFYDASKWLNVFFITFISIFGLYGNSISIYIFLKTLKQNRNQKSTIYFLLLSISDLFVLVFHYLDFTLRSWINLTGNYSSRINFVDKCLLCCKLIPYFRNVFRTISVYILLIMTVQRFIYFYFPLKRSLVSSAKTNKIIIFNLIFMSLILNAGIIFVNTLTEHDTNGELYCNINPEFIDLQFIFDFVFVLFSILIPTLFILLFSFILFCRIKSNIPIGNDFFKIDCCTSGRSEDEKNDSLNIHNTNETNYCVNFDEKLSQIHSKRNEKKRALNSLRNNGSRNNSNNKGPKFKTKFNHSIRTTYMLVLLSKWFVILHLPYFICWIILHFQIKDLNLDNEKISQLINLNQTNVEIYTSEVNRKYVIQLDYDQNLTLMSKEHATNNEDSVLMTYSYISNIGFQNAIKACR